MAPFGGREATYIDTLAYPTVIMRDGEVAHVEMIEPALKLLLPSVPGSQAQEPGHAGRVEVLEVVGTVLVGWPVDEGAAALPVSVDGVAERLEGAAGADIAFAAIGRALPAAALRDQLPVPYSEGTGRHSLVEGEPRPLLIPQLGNRRNLQKREGGW